MANGNDLSLIISEWAFNAKILAGYLEGINKALSEVFFKPGSSGSSDSSMKVSWDKITVGDYSPLVVYDNFKAYLNPQKQTIDFIMTDFTLESNPFDMKVEYIPYPITKKAAIKCPGTGKISMKSYNISISYYLIKPSQIIPSRDKNINISDCELAIRLKNNSVKIDFPKHDMPLQYSFDNEACNKTLDISLLEDIMRDTLDTYFRYVLPIQWDNQLQASLSKLIHDQQYLHLHYDNITTRELICIRHNTILDNGDLEIIADLILPNQTVNFQHPDSIGNFTVPQVNGPGDPIIWDALLSALTIILLCCTIGWICTLKSIGGYCMKRKRKDKSLDVQSAVDGHNLLIDVINNGGDDSQEINHK